MNRSGKQMAGAITGLLCLWGIVAAMALPPVRANTTGSDVSPSGKKSSVVARINGAEIKLDQLNGELYRAEKLVIDAGKVLTASQVAALQAQLLESLVQQELLYQEALKKNCTATDTEIAAALDNLKPQFKSEADFEKAAPDLKSQVDRSMAIRNYVKSVFIDKIEVPDQEIRAYYDHHLDNFRQPGQIRAGYILIKVDPQGDAARKAAALERIETIRRKVLAGDDFAELARTASEDVTASQGGDLGFIRKGQMLGPLEEALFALKPGEVSPVVETGAGLNLVTAYEHTPETTLPFGEVKDGIRTLLQQEKGQQAASTYIAEVRKTAEVETFLSTRP